MSLKITDEYFIGFVEGEGMFYIGIVPSSGTSKTKSGWQVIYFFKVSQNPNGKSVLKQLKERLDCGYIKENDKVNPTDKTLSFVVRDLPNLRDKVIPFFDGKLVIKKGVFEKFKQIIKMVDKKEHLDLNGMEQLINIAYSMNTKKRKVSKEVILKSYNN